MNIKAKTYAHALWQDIQSKDKKETSALVEALDNFDALYSQDQRVHDFLKHPKITVEEKKKFIDAFVRVEKVEPMVSSFLALLLQQSNLDLLAGIVTSLKQIMRDTFGMLVANVTVAQAFTEHQKKELASKIKELFGAEQVDLVEKIDTSLLGGFSVEIDGQMIDFSMKRKLTMIREKVLQE